MLAMTGCLMQQLQMYRTFLIPLFYQVFIRKGWIDRTGSCIALDKTARIGRSIGGGQVIYHYSVRRS